jgi:hypothetical protein
MSAKLPKPPPRPLKPPPPPPQPQPGLVHVLPAVGHDVLGPYFSGRYGVAGVHVKATLARLLRGSLPGLRLNEHLAHDGDVVFRHACKMGRFVLCAGPKRPGSSAPAKFSVPNLLRRSQRGRAWDF